MKFLKLKYDIIIKNSDFILTHRHLCIYYINLTVKFTIYNFMSQNLHTWIGIHNKKITIIKRIVEFISQEKKSFKKKQKKNILNTNIILKIISNKKISPGKML